MAKQTASFIDLHVEKLVIGVAALVLVGTVGYYFVGKPYAIDDKGPTELCEESRKAADDTIASVRRAQHKAEQKAPGQPVQGIGALSELARWFGDKAEGLVRIAGLDNPAPRTQPFYTPLLTVVGVAEEDRHGLATLVAPSAPVVTTGKTFLEMPVLTSAAGPSRGAGSRQNATESVEKSWVSVGAQIDLYSQLQNFVSAKYRQGAARSLPIVRVHLQRKAVGGDTDWEDVNTFIPTRVPVRPRVEFENGRVSPSSQRDLNEYQDMVRRNQEMIARPPLPEKTPESRGDDAVAVPLPFYPDAPAKDDNEQIKTQRVRDWISMAQKAMDGKKPFGQSDPEAAGLLASAAMTTGFAKPTDKQKATGIYESARKACRSARRPVPSDQPREPEWLMPIVAHDLEVREGQRYIYRMRYEIINAFVGDPVEMKDMADAQKLTIVSDWSPPSREVEVKSDIYYFLTSDNARNGEVTFTIHKRVTGGEWARSTSRVKLGEPIGKKDKNVDYATGMVCVDINFKPAEAKAREVTVVLASVEDGSLREHSKLRDSRAEEDFRKRARQ